jgi:hypothetical protein
MSPRLSDFKAYTIQITFANAADAEQYTRFLIERAEIWRIEARRQANCVTVSDLLLPYPDNDPDEYGKTSLTRRLDRKMEGDLLNAFEDDVSNRIRPGIPKPYWEIMDKRPLTLNDKRYLRELLPRAPKKPLDSEAAKEAVRKFLSERRAALRESADRSIAEEQLIEAGRDVLGRLEDEME